MWHRTKILCFCLMITVIITLSFGASYAQSYKVKKGDNLHDIAKKYHVSVEEIKEANKLKTIRLMPGDKITVPAKASAKNTEKSPEAKDAKNKKSSNEPAANETAVYHTVKKGDTPAGVSKKYSISVKELLELNNLKSAKRLKPGQRLLVRKPSESPKETDDSAELAKAEIRERLLEIKQAEEQMPDEEKTKDIKKQLMMVAKMMLNIPYKFGGNTLKGIDCSAYVQKVFNVMDIFLPRAAREQFQIGTPVAKEELNIGDLVFFRTYAKFPSHVGIYIGDNQFIHASSKGKKVTIDSLDEPYYTRRFIGAKRLITDDAQENDSQTNDEEKANTQYEKIMQALDFVSS